jgi:outer membrane lipoprotein SlyB
MHDMLGRSTLLLLFSLGACASIPSGPSVMVLPGSGKTFDEFRNDDFYCKQYASEQVRGVTPNQASVSSGIGSAAVGAGLGAATGAALGGGTGAAIGAGSGLLGGGLVGSSTARDSGYITQQRYDMGYIQCMYAKGHRVPIAGQIMDNASTSRPGQSMSVPPRMGDSGRSPPPPPPGNPPPPPPQ